MILFFACIFALGWPVVFGTRPRRGLAAGVLLLSLVIQVQFEGFRWQLVPLYLTAIGLAVGDVFFLERKVEWSNRITRGLLGMLGLGVAVALPLLLPVPDLPVPSGPETVGTTSVQIIDRSRDEIYGPRPGGPRELMAQVWYPAELDELSEVTTWSEDWDVVAPAMARDLGFPSWFLNHTRYTDANSSRPASLAEGSYPVIIYSHGWTGFRTVAVNQMELLASNGFIVIAPDHTYGSVAVRLEDGEVVPNDPEALPDEEEIGAEAYAEASTALVDTYAADIVSILNELDSGSEGAFAEIVDGADLNLVGIFGHSTGGGAAVKVCLTDERCDAVLGMDPWVEPLVERDLRNTMTRPALYMRSDGWRDTPNDALLRGIAARGEEVTYWLAIDGASHNDFTVAPFFSPVAGQLGLVGSIPAGRLVPIVDNYLLGFFDVFLLGTGSAALDSVSFEEVSVVVIEPTG